ncbi:flagellar hook-length control protein FliK [Fulvimonas sp. R45]|uniref:flagellar hook-length control protein FliK n=1 Tax=Fulvimonas sp. R45 TaxID=3045937 RepID=UPI00265D66E4|nr:flagellar hook-length control protein FliK [Fulvimonas sp. R45]MDO1528358.1 flagellar hook-length control protein FliK [Fulvimonas sp. R45]
MSAPIPPSTAVPACAGGAAPRTDASDPHGFGRQLDAVRGAGEGNAKAAGRDASPAPAPTPAPPDGTGQAAARNGDDDDADDADDRGAAVPHGHDDAAPVAPLACWLGIPVVPVAAAASAATAAGVAAWSGRLATTLPAGGAGAAQAVTADAPSIEVDAMGAALPATFAPASPAVAMPPVATAADGDAKARMDDDLGDLPIAPQPAASPAAPAPAPAPHVLELAAPAGGTAFAQELGQQVVWLGAQGVKQASIRLHPQALGTLEVKVSLGHDGRVDVSFAAQHPAAVAAVQQSLGQLDLMLAGQGLSLGQAQVGQQGTDRRDGHVARRDAGTGDEAVAETPGVAALSSVASGLLDIFA